MLRCGLADKIAQMFDRLRWIAVCSDYRSGFDAN
jgi:hypothetical protein